MLRARVWGGLLRKGGAVQWDKYLCKYDVIRIVMTDFFKKGVTIDAALDRLQKLVVRDLTRAYPEVDFFDKNDLLQSLQDVYSEKKTQFVIVLVLRPMKLKCFVKSGGSIIMG